MIWLDEETEDLSSLPSQMETPNTPASQLFQPSDVTTSSTRAYFRRGRPCVMRLKIVMRQSFIIYDMYLNFDLADIFYFNYGIMIPFLIQYLNVLLTKIEYVMLYF